ncbi:MAG: hypothetical protein U0836_23410 [Pirellulales bacterium]
MAEYTIPKNAGMFRVVVARAGNALVINDRSGKNAVRIPCKSREQADELCTKLNAGDHAGRVRA